LIEVTGSKGTLRLDLEDDLIGGEHGAHMSPLADDLSLPLPESFGMGGGGAFAACEPLFLTELIAAIAAGESSLHEAATFADGVQCMKVLDAARESSRQGGIRIACL
jgi:predicted dehydrogenase